MKDAAFWVLVALPLLPALNLGGFDAHSLRILAPAAAAVLFLGGIYRKKFEVPLHPAFWLFLAFCIVAAASIVWAKEPAFAFRKTLFVWSLGPPALYLGFYGAHRMSWDRLAAWLGYAGVVAAGTGLAQFFAQFLVGPLAVLAVVKGLGVWFWGGATQDAVFSFQSFFVAVNRPVLRAFFPFPDPHTFGLFLGLAALPLLAKAIRQEKNRRIASISFAAVALGILLSFSRGSWIALFLGLSVFLAISWGGALRAVRAQVILISCAAILASALVPQIRSRAATILNLHEGSAAARLQLWRETSDVFWTAPLLGVGVGGLASTLAPGQPFRVPTNAHNLFLEVVAETGLAGLILLSGALGWACVTLARTKDIFAKGLAASLAVFIAHSVFETTLYSPQTLFVVAFLIGAASHKNPEPPHHSEP